MARAHRGARARSQNSAAAQALGQLQRQYPAGTPLRSLIFLNADVPDPSKPAAHADAANLFTGGGRSLAVGLSTPMATVFAANWADISPTRLGSTKYAFYYELSTTTVANDAFGVAAGSPVDVLVISLDGPIPLTFGVTSDETNYDLLGSYAADAASPDVEAFVKAWLERTA